MLLEQTLQKLYDLKLNGMAEALQDQIQQPNIHDLTFEERFALLVDHQWTWKENRRMKRLLKNARLKINAAIEDIDFKSPRGISKSVILSLASCDWIRSAQNVIITGPTGVGKTYLACALANRACREGFSSLYVRSPRLFHDVAIARADGSYLKLMNKLAKANLLIIDDLGLAPMTEHERRDLLEIIEDRNDLFSTIAVSQIPIKLWHENIGDPTIADAILDRLIHKAHKITLKGESMRKLRSALTQKQNSEKQ
jgi:DNA replication protein DnaC